MRHPPPDVASDVCYGRADVPPVEARLLPEIRGMVSRLHDVLEGRRPTAIHSSPLQRARRAAQAMAGELGLSLQIDARLAEMDFGAWEMRRWDDIDRTALDAWAADVCGFTPPGGECARDVLRRMDAWARALRSSATHDDVHLVVAHAGPIRLHTATALRLPTTACLAWTLDFGHLCHLRIAGDGRARLIRWNA
ncbi:Phosphoserine phosphatase 1 [Pandoraea anhela]|uniref:Phosphoserine phosphatase 1 n=2 Tax=Pandoraea anhela TaxID=2508295 RepID=A0A5E4Z985_9BURK|nr:Phosphoserine phosphatase 1 [Pandoraea anhela]